MLVEIASVPGPIVDAGFGLVVSLLLRLLRPYWLQWNSP